MIQFLQGLSLFLALVVFYALYRGIYNRYFHPLRNFPGPFWGSVSDFSKLWILHTKQAHTLGLKYHEKYGPVVRAAPNLLAVNDPLLLPQIYHRRVDKTDVYTTGVLGELAPPFQTIKHEDHAAKRKRVANSVGAHQSASRRGCLLLRSSIPETISTTKIIKFTLTNLKPLEGQIDARVVQWTSVLNDKFARTGKKLDFAQWSQYV